VSAPVSQAPPAFRVRLGQALAFALRTGPAAAVEVGVNIAAPFLVYTMAKPSLGDVRALMAASAPPLAWSIIEFARRRRIDALSLLVLAGIMLSLVAFLGGGGAKALQLREQLVIGLIGLVFLVSAAIRRPLIYQLARARLRRRSAADGQVFEALRDSPAFKRAIMVMTLVWGVGMVLECGLCVALVLVLSIQQYLIISPIIGYAALGLFTAWTFWYARRRIGPVRAALEESQRPTSPA
jgi:hypothetical protein